MRAAPNMRTQKWRLPDPGNGMVYSADNEGMYEIPYRGARLKVIASEGLDWDHVSVSLRHRCPIA